MKLLADEEAEGGEHGDAAVLQLHLAVELDLRRAEQVRRSLCESCRHGWVLLCASILPRLPPTPQPTQDNDAIIALVAVAAAD